jgi:hypothetical protein
MVSEATEERAPFFDVHPQTGATIEVFYADRALETFGRCGAGWFWWDRRRGTSPAGPATGPFATSYSAYRHAINRDTSSIGDAWRRSLTYNVNADTVRTRDFSGGGNSS